MEQSTVCENVPLRNPKNTWKEGKELCLRCNFYVKLEGHESRCNPIPTGVEEKKDTWALPKTQAWLGDTLHRFDIQVISLMLNIPDKEREAFVQKYCSGASQSIWYIQHVDKDQDISKSKMISTIFESKYAEMREKYIEIEFGGKGVSSKLVSQNISNLYK